MIAGSNDDAQAAQATLVYSPESLFMIIFAGVPVTQTDHQNAVWAFTFEDVSHESKQAVSLASSIQSAFADALITSIVGFQPACAVWA